MTGGGFVDLVRELASLLADDHGERLEERLSGLAESPTEDLEERPRVYRNKATGALDLVILTPKASETVTLEDLSSMLGPGRRVAARKLEDPERSEFAVESAASSGKCIVSAVLEPWVRATPQSRVVEVSLKVTRHLQSVPG